MKDIWVKIRKAWYYFRRGYNVYLSLPVAVVSNSVIVYEFLIKNTIYASLIPSFLVFIILFTPTIACVSILMGVIERRKKIFETEMEISYAESPQIKVILNKLDNIERRLNHEK